MKMFAVLRINLIDHYPAYTGLIGSIPVYNSFENAQKEHPNEKIIELNTLEGEINE